MDRRKSYTVDCSSSKIKSLSWNHAFEPFPSRLPINIGPGLSYNNICLSNFSAVANYGSAFNTISHSRFLDVGAYFELEYVDSIIAVLNGKELEYGNNLG